MSGPLTEERLAEAAALTLEDLRLRSKSSLEPGMVAAFLAEIVSLRASLAGSEEWLKGCNSRLVEVLRERDEARRVANDWHDEYVKMSETNLGNLGESSKAKSAMRARIAEMEEGLRPFAWLAEILPDDGSDDRPWYSHNDLTITRRDIRRAAALLAKPPSEPSK